MIFPEITYAFQGAKDLAGGTCDTVLRQVNFVQAVQTANHVAYRVPLDRCLILTSAVVSGASITAGEEVERLFLSVRPLAGVSTGALIADYRPLGAITRTTLAVLNWSGQILVPPGGDIIGSATFEVARASNTAQVSISGVSIPRANVQAS